MQKSPLVCFLSGALAVAALGVFALIVLCEYRVRQKEALDPQIATAQMNQANLSQIAAEAMEYSKHNPAIDPILRDVNLKATGKK
ncbi:MAG: hypothetical protein RL380_391 [Verrucomicrobiota bacterium]|jgi:hypothetical protein